MADQISAPIRKELKLARVTQDELEDEFCMKNPTTVDAFNQALSHWSIHSHNGCQEVMKSHGSSAVLDLPKGNEADVVSAAIDKLEGWLAGFNFVIYLHIEDQIEKGKAREALERLQQWRPNSKPS